MSTNRINLSLQQYVRVNQKYGSIIIEALAGDCHVALSENRPSTDNVAFHKLTDRQRLCFDRVPTNVWVLARNTTSQAVVSEYHPESGWTWFDVAQNFVRGAAAVKKFGRNASVGTSYTPVALSGNYRTPQSSGATALRVKAGGNANDTADGSGARAITLIGLDENFNETAEVLETAGASASSATTTTFTRLFRAFVSSSGTYASQIAGSHAGEITIEDAAGTEDWCQIDATAFPKGQTEIGAYSIPAGKTAFVKLRDVSIDSGKTIDMVFFVRESIDETEAPYSAMRAQSVVSGVTGGSIETFGPTDAPFGPYTGPCDVGFMAKVAAGSASVSVEFEIIMVDT